MGYRRLLKSYMHHVNAVLGTDLVELAAMTNALHKRDVGELRTVAAELKRASFDESAGATYDHVVREMLQAGQIRVEQLAAIEGLEVGADDETLSDDMFRRILITLLEFSEPANAEADAEGFEPDTQLGTEEVTAGNKDNNPSISHR